MAYECNFPYLIILKGIVSEKTNIYKGWLNQIDQGKLMLWGQILSYIDFYKVNADLHKFGYDRYVTHHHFQKKLNCLGVKKCKIRTLTLDRLFGPVWLGGIFSWSDIKLMNSIRKEMCQTWWLHQELWRKLLMNSRKINKGNFRKCKWKCSSGINWIIKFLVIFCHK